jgi:hypothetical protein
MFLKPPINISNPAAFIKIAGDPGYASKPAKISFKPQWLSADKVMQAV